MKHNPMTCDPGRIEMFLQQRLSEAEQAAFELHLDDCGDCRDRLESAAATRDVWSEVRESLNVESLSLNEAHVQAHAGAAEPDTVFSRDTIVNLLGPTDDDRMIGRLGTYEILGIIGAGGMGVVLKAFDPALNRNVAIKMLAPYLGSSGAARKRFSREAQAAAAVVHENVIEIHGVADADGLPYLVMPYVRGPSLQRRLNEEGPLAPVEILRIGMQAANGLAAAHAQGLVHRDVKPANILLADGVERATLTDFGLARAADDVSLTKTGIIAGTPQYMSPEQARGESVDARSDLFSLGSVLYAMCTGRPPFRAETSYGILRRITDEEPQAIREINPEIPEWLCEVIVRLMSKQRHDRFESADEVAVLLEECLAHVQQPTVVPVPGHQPPTPQTVNPQPAQSRPWRRRTAAVAVIVGLLAVVAWQAVAPPDISGKWEGNDWGEVILERTSTGGYEGTFHDLSDLQGGTITLRWSPVERRFNGVWNKGDDLGGDLSVRAADNEIHGAWTTSEQSRTEHETPELADLHWVRPATADLQAVTNRLIGRWKLVPSGSAGRVRHSDDGIFLTIDAWKITWEVTWKNDAEGPDCYLYKVFSNGVVRFIEEEADSERTESIGRVSFIDHDTMWLAVARKDRTTPPRSARPDPREKNVSYHRFVRVRQADDDPFSSMATEPAEPTAVIPATEAQATEPQVTDAEGDDRQDVATPSDIDKSLTPEVPLDDRNPIQVRHLPQVSVVHPGVKALRADLGSVMRLTNDQDQKVGRQLDSFIQDMAYGIADTRRIRVDLLTRVGMLNYLVWLPFTKSKHLMTNLDSIGCPTRRHSDEPQLYSLTDLKSSGWLRILPAHQYVAIGFQTANTDNFIRDLVLDAGSPEAAIGQLMVPGSAVTARLSNSQAGRASQLKRLAVFQELRNRGMAALPRRAAEAESEFGLRRDVVSAFYDEFERVFVEAETVDVWASLDRDDTSMSVSFDAAGIPETSLSRSIGQHGRVSDAFAGVKALTDSVLSVRLNHPVDNLRQKNATHLLKSWAAAAGDRVDHSAVLLDSEKKATQTIIDDIVAVVCDGFVSGNMNGFVEARHHNSGFGLVGALSAPGSRQLLQTLQQLPMARAGNTVDLNVAQVDQITLHRIRLTEGLGELYDQLFGTAGEFVIGLGQDQIWLATGPAAEQVLIRTISEIDTAVTSDVTLTVEAKLAPWISRLHELAQEQEVPESAEARTAHHEHLLWLGQLQESLALDDQLTFAISGTDAKLSGIARLGEGPLTFFARRIAGWARKRLEL